MGRSWSESALLPRGLEDATAASPPVAGNARRSPAPAADPPREVHAGPADAVRIRRAASLDRLPRRRESAAEGRIRPEQARGSAAPSRAAQTDRPAESTTAKPAQPPRGWLESRTAR